MSLKAKLKRNVGKYKESMINTSIYKAYDEGIDESIVYVESRDGNDFTGNIFRIVEEISTGKYGNLKVYVYVKPEVEEKIRQLQENYNLNIYKIMTKESIATRILERAKYIFTDSGIRPKFIKRPGQIMLNTWHGTPLKVMGVTNVPEQHRIGSIQHSFLDADYLLYPNEFMCRVMLEGYMVDRIYPGKVLLEGYPRNSVFLDNQRKEEMKSRLNFSGKEVFVYMPTYRGTFLNRKNTAQKDRISQYLEELDSGLNDNQVLLVKLHVFNQSQIDFSKFDHIEAFPQGYEGYDMLNMADVLITDYSSVFFDYAASGRKIIIFNYDEEEYLSDRKVYFPISDLPFPQVQNVDDLILELNSPKGYDDAEFMETYCRYENPDAAKRICREIFKGEDVVKKIDVKNDNPNILVYAGSMSDEEILSTLIDNLSKIDPDRANVFVSYRQWDENIIENHEHIFESMPDGVSFLPYRGQVNPTRSEKKAFDKIISNEFKGDYPVKLDKLFEREIERYYHKIKFDVAINFDGNDISEMLMFKCMECKTILFARNNALQPNILKEIYSSYDYIIADSEDLKEYISNIAELDDNVMVNSMIENLLGER